jgi:hypothetical protein
MCAQFQAVTYTKILKPLNKTVLQKLQNLVTANQKSSWFTRYLVLFILLHSCSILTKQNEEYARKMCLEVRKAISNTPRHKHHSKAEQQTEYANSESILEFHRGAESLLAYFHYCNNGQRPFALARDPAQLQDFADATKLDNVQIKFIQDTSAFVQTNCG